MLQKIIQFSVRNKLIVGLMIIGLIGFGAYNVTLLPIDAVPDITNNQVMVITTSPSLGAADIERLITFPIEQNTRNIPGIIEQRSFSRFGLSLVTIVFDDNTDIYWARQQVAEKLVQVQEQIPAGLGVPSMGPVTTGLGEVYQYVVRPEPGYESKYTAMELRTIQDWVVRRQLLGTNGVADVSSFGGELKQYEVALNTDKLNSFGLTISEVFDALSRNNQNTGGAYIEKGAEVLYIRTEGLITSQEEIEQIPVKYTQEGIPVLVRDVGTVQYGISTRYGAMCYNDQGEVAGGVVMMLKGANSSVVIEDIKTRIGEIQQTLPEGVVIEAFLDRTKMVNNALDTVFTNLAEGALIVVFILVLFLGNFRAGLLVASVIPLAMLFAIIMMNLFGVSGNLMSLGALDFGLIVDGTVIIVEAIMHRLHINGQQRGLTRIDQKMMDEEVGHSTGKIMKSAAFGQVIILIVYLPFFVLRGVEGKMFMPMAQTVSFAIIGAFLLSLTYVPMMSALFLSKKVNHKKTIADRMMNALQRFYQPLLVRALRVPKTMIAASVVLLVTAVMILRGLGGEFIPELEEGDFAVDTRVLTGSSLTTTIKATQQTAAILVNQFPEVEKVVTKIGSGEIPTDPMPMEASDMMVILKPKDQWTSAETFDELAEKMSEAVSQVPGVTTGFQFPVQMRFNELMTGSRQDVVCKIFGENLDTLAAYAERIGAIAGNVEGAKDIYVESVTGLPQIVINYNRAAIAQYGLSVEEINRTVESAFAGAVCGQVFENERRFDMVVRLEKGNRSGIGDVQNLLLSSPRGEQIQLRQVADVSIQVGPNQIQREEAQRRITVGFNVRGRDVQSVVKELQENVKSGMRFPAGYSITYGGQFENLIAARQRLSIAVPIALVMIFLLLYFAFNSIAQGLLIYSAIPLAAIGGIFTLWLTDMPFSISAGVGFIALFGVAVLNGIVLISEFNALKKNGVTDVHDRVLKGTRTLLRPVLMTAAVASFGFLPMALSHGSGAEVQRPLASVVIGGLITATILTLFVLPVLYMLIEQKRRGARSRFSPASIFRKMKYNNLMKRRKQRITAIVAILCTTFSFASQAQTISLQAAIDSSMRQNPAVQAAMLHALSVQSNEKSAMQLPGTEISFEYGKLNSYSNDNRIGIRQSFDFPLVYTTQKRMAVTATALAAEQEQLVRLTVRKEVTQLYYRMCVMLERKALLQHADSLYAGFLSSQESRFSSGDINRLEHTAAGLQRMQIGNQLISLDADLKILQLQFAQLLNTVVTYLPQVTSLKISPLVKQYPDITQHPLLRAGNYAVQMEQTNVRLSRLNMLPQFSIGYYNMSIIGWQTVNSADVYFGPSSRFTSIMAGVTVPLYFPAGMARVKSARLRWQSEQFRYQDLLLQKNTELLMLLEKKEALSRTLSNYESTAIPSAMLLEEDAASQFNSGGISYTEWILLTNQSILIRSAYLDTIDQWNQTLTEINALTGQL